MELLELRGKCFFPKIPNLSRQKSRMKRNLRKIRISSDLSTRYYSFTSDVQYSSANTPSPPRKMPLRYIESVLQKSKGSSIKSPTNNSHSPEKEQILTSVHIKTGALNKSSLRLTGNLYRISKNLSKQSKNHTLYKKFLEIGCQSEL